MYANSTESENLDKLLKDTDDWLYTDEGFKANYTIYNDKLKSMKDIMNIIEFKKI